MWICVSFFFRRLDSNLLECDCDIKWLWTYLRTNAGRVHATAVCHGPANLRGRHLSQLTEADFNCGMMWHIHTHIHKISALLVELFIISKITTENLNFNLCARIFRGVCWSLVAANIYQCKPVFCLLHFHF